MHILILEDDPHRHHWFRQNLIGASVTITDRVSEALSLLETRRYDVIFLDYDLEKGSDPNHVGLEVVLTVVRCPRCLFGPHWVVHSLNERGGALMYEALYGAGAAVSRAPFAWQDENLLYKLREVVKA